MRKGMVGENAVHIEDDLIYTITHTPSTLELVREFFTFVEPVFAAYGHAFLITDASRTLAVGADARRAIAEWGKTHRVAASAVFGPSLTVRAMLTLITSAMKLIGNGDQNIRYFATESAARHWIDEQRRKFYAFHPKASS